MFIMTVAKLKGLDLLKAKESISKFKGLKYRMECIGTYDDVTYSEPLSKNIAINSKESILYYISELQIRYLSGMYTEESCKVMKEEELRLSAIVDLLDKDINRFERWETEHYYAAITWQSLREYGLSDVVTAAIIGNMMVETSGGTLNLKPHVYSKDRGFYGLCQWSLYYRPDVAEMQFEDQLVYLYNDLAGEIDNFGFCYKKGFTYSDFWLMTDVREAAIAFAKVYERCTSSSYNKRADCAEIAYKYFMNEENVQ